MQCMQPERHNAWGVEAAACRDGEVSRGRCRIACRTATQRTQRSRSACTPRTERLTWGPASDAPRAAPLPSAASAVAAGLLRGPWGWPARGVGVGGWGAGGRRGQGVARSRGGRAISLSSQEGRCCSCGCLPSQGAAHTQAGPRAFALSAQLQRQLCAPGWAASAPFPARTLLAAPLGAPEAAPEGGLAPPGPAPPPAAPCCPWPPAAPEGLAALLCDLSALASLSAEILSCTSASIAVRIST